MLLERFILKIFDAKRGNVFGVNWKSLARDGVTLHEIDGQVRLEATLGYQENGGWVRLEPESRTSVKAHLFDRVIERVLQDLPNIQ